MSSYNVDFDEEQKTSAYPSQSEKQDQANIDNQRGPLSVNTRASVDCQSASVASPSSSASVSALAAKGSCEGCKKVSQNVLPESLTMSHGEDAYPYGVADRYSSFYCDGCGECCRHVNNGGEAVEMFRKLDRGDGVCINLDGDLCRIYHERPDWCSVDGSYNAYFKNHCTRKEFYDMNYRECYRLKIARNAKLQDQ